MMALAFNTLVAVGLWLSHEDSSKTRPQALVNVQVGSLPM